MTTKRSLTILALIQGNYIARYVGKQQKEVYNIDWKAQENQNNLLSIVEQVRSYEE